MESMFVNIKAVLLIIKRKAKIIVFSYIKNGEAISN